MVTITCEYGNFEKPLPLGGWYHNTGVPKNKVELVVPHDKHFHLLEIDREWHDKLEKNKILDMYPQPSATGPEVHHVQMVLGSMDKIEINFKLKPEALKDIKNECSRYECLYKLGDNIYKLFISKTQDGPRAVIVRQVDTNPMTF